MAKVAISGLSDYLSGFSTGTGIILSVSGTTASVLMDGKNITADIVFNGVCQDGVGYLFRSGDEVNVVKNGTQYAVLGHASGRQELPSPGVFAVQDTGGNWYAVNADWSHLTPLGDVVPEPYQNALGTEAVLAIEGNGWYLQFNGCSSLLLASNGSFEGLPEGTLIFAGAVVARRYTTPLAGTCYVCWWLTSEAGVRQYWNVSLRYLCRERVFRFLKNPDGSFTLPLDEGGVNVVPYGGFVTI